VLADELIRQTAPLGSSRLLARLKNPAEPERPLDVELALAFAWSFPRWPARPSFEDYVAAVRHAMASASIDPLGLRDAAELWGVPRFTRSLDDVTALVQRAAPDLFSRLSVRFGPHPGAGLTVGMQTVWIDAPTPARAVAAVLVSSAAGAAA
jgi:hypothetical protein